MCAYFVPMRNQLASKPRGTQRGINLDQLRTMLMEILFSVEIADEKSPPAANRETRSPQASILIGKDFIWNYCEA